MDVYNKFVSQLDHKIKMQFTSEKKDNNLYSGWEINRITNQFNEIYYKNELLRNIEELIRSGTKPSDIWIVDNSIDTKKKYIKYKTGKIDLSQQNSIELLYYLGSPTSMYTNKNLMLLSLAFDAFRNAFSICNKYQLHTPNKTNELSNIFYNINRGNIYDLVDYLFNLIIEFNNNLDAAMIKKVDSDLKRELQHINNNFIVLLNKKMEENISYTKDLLNYDIFNSKFNAYERPIVLVRESSEINNNYGQIRILCIDFLVNEKFKKNNPRFLETNLISQNSPLEYIITIGITALPSLITIYKTRRDLMILKKESYENEQRNQEEIREIDSKLLIANSIISELTEENNILEGNFHEFKNQNNIREVADSNNLAALQLIDQNKGVNANKGAKWMIENDLNLTSTEMQNIS